MKKITLSVLTVMCAVGSMLGQVTSTITAPPYDGSASAISAPSGTLPATYHRSCWLVLASELQSGMVLTNSLVTAVGFDFAQLVNTNVTGNFTVSLENTTDVTYQKGTAWATNISTMTPHFLGSMTLPNNAAFVDVTLTTPFTYNGGGIYISFEWETTSASASTSRAWVTANSTGLPTTGGAYANAQSLAPPTLTTLAFRPCVRWQVGNAATNEVEVTAIYAPGKVSKLSAGGHIIEARIQNNSNTTLTNIPVTLAVVGANTFNDTQTVTSLAAGATTTLAFNPFIPTVAGLNTMSVTVPADQVNNNNFMPWAQQVGCTDWGFSPPVPASSFTSNSWGFTASGIYSRKFVPVSNEMLSGVRLALATSTANPGKDLYGVLMNNTGAIVATTNTINVTSAMQGTFVKFDFATPQALTAGQTYFVGVAHPQAPMFPFATLASPNYTVQGYYSSPLTGGTLTQINRGWIGIEAILSYTNLNVSVTASPAVICEGKTTTLVVTGPANSTYTWSGNGSGNTATLLATPVVPSTQASLVANYFVNGNDPGSNCALNTAAIQVTVNSEPNITVSSKTICLNTKTTLTLSNASSFTVSGGSFSNSPATSSLLSVDPKATTDYSVFGTNGVGCTNSTPAVGKVTVNACTGINDYPNAANVNIYPNPAANGLTKVVNLEGKNTIAVYNTLGQVVTTVVSEENTVELDLSKQPAGNYLIRIMNDDNTVKTLKLVNPK